MDLMLLIGIATALLVILVTLFFIQRKNAPAEQPKAAPQRGVPVRAQEGVPRRAQIARNQRNRIRQNVAAAPAAAAALDNAMAAEAGAEDEAGEDGVPQGQVLDEKMGAKKRAKLEAKEQKRLLREHELKQREERKVKEAKQDEERKLQEDQEAEHERKQAEAERLAREERERKEHEEYLKMKEAFSVEEEGYEEADDAEKENLLMDFINYIKQNKVVVLEELATEFKLKTVQVIERIQELQANNTLTGVIDDRGKFIYISEDELKAVAKFIKQRGRVSLADIAECSNNLINLTPVASV